MPLDPVLVADTRAWLRKAETDVKAARHDFTASPPLLSDVVFHCQQAIEKILKGFLMWHGLPFRKTHSLEELGEQCLDVDSTLKDLVDRAVPLTEYAWKFRYPGDLEEPSLEEAQEALQITQEFYETMLLRFPLEVCP
ncbi:MAG: HEPN domain-containing protein [Desulfobaccales bacterium]